MDGLRAIYYKEIDVHTEIETHIFEETLRRFNLATAKGLAESIDPEIITDRFLYELRTNNAVFSAFRTHRMQNDIAAQLIDPETGRLKSFDRWKLDIKGMTDHYCNAWLQTEYDTAIIRAHQAADWKHFLEEADVFPNVRWMPTTSITPDPLHQHYWEKRLTLPVNHPFWDEHHPGDRWNCKCSLEQTDEPVNGSALEDYTPPLPMPGLDNNPAKDGKIFSDTHPYYTEAYPGAQEAVTDFLKKRSPSSMRRTEEEKEDIRRRWEERKSKIENDKAIAKALGMDVPIKEMTFEEANNGRTNPNFFKGGLPYRTNCQLCVISHEMRLRGWNVEALPLDMTRLSKAFSSMRTETSWIDPKTNALPKVNGIMAKSVKEQFRQFFEGTKEPGRYHFYNYWKNGDAHIMTFERMADGNAFFYDPQEPVAFGFGGKRTPEEFLNMFAKHIKPSLPLVYYRVDNLNLNPEIAAYAIKKKL